MFASNYLYALDAGMERRKTETKSNQEDVLKFEINEPQNKMYQSQWG